MLLTTGIIIIYVLNSVIVYDNFLLNLFIYLFINCCDILILHYIIILYTIVYILHVYNPRLFHSLDLITKSW